MVLGKRAQALEKRIELLEKIEKSSPWNSEILELNKELLIMEQQKSSPDCRMGFSPVVSETEAHLAKLI